MGQLGTSIFFSLLLLLVDISTVIGRRSMMAADADLVNPINHNNHFVATRAARDDLPQPPAWALTDLVEPRLRADLSFLSSPLLEGRAPGTRGEALAAAYIGAQLEKLNHVKPGGENGTFYQRVPLRATTVYDSAPLSLNSTTGKGGLSLEFGEHYVANSDLVTPEISINLSDSLIFVGYGIHAPEYNWDDYKGVDVTGKVVLMLVNQPNTGAFAGQSLTYYGRWTYKYEEARRRKAVAAILIHTLETAGYPWQVVVSSNSGEQVQAAGEVKNGLKVWGWIDKGSANALADLTTSSSLSDWFAAANRQTFRPLNLGIDVATQMKFRNRNFDGTNVVGVLPGANASQAVVISGHLDHLGIKNGTIYPGAIDNASGASLVLSVAHAFNGLDHQMERSLVFLFPTAEESGLLGSAYFVENPSVDSQFLACINFDIGNAWGLTQDISLLGGNKSSLASVFAQATKWENMFISPDPDPAAGFFFRSDHFSFAKKGVPGVWVYLGSHFVGQDPDYYQRVVKDGYFNHKYHSPWDSFNATIAHDLGGMIQQARLAMRAAFSIADSTYTPVCAPTGCI